MHDIYQFSKYNSHSSAESFKKKGCLGEIICFDLEDSIYNWIDNKGNDHLKAGSRKILNNLLLEFNSESIDLKIGIRINSCDSGYQNDDIASIPHGIKIHSILIPKVETSNHIDDVAQQLRAKGILFSELIPIIETSKGLNNLSTIIKANYEVTKVGFGHCDYNLSIGSFPFFHQDTIEYWKWVIRMLSVLRPANIKFINSACLRLNEPDFFQLMLSHLQFLYKDNFGQFTLTHEQTRLCNLVIKELDLHDGIARNRLDLSVNNEMLTNQVATFENENKGRGFTISHKNGVLMSPQEYSLAKLRLSNKKEKDINFTFVGGCFPVQGDILFEDIFHQTLTKNVENELIVNFNVNIIRYEKIGNCLEKIVSYAHTKPIDYLVFHVRPEPYLRLIKLYYKYLNYDYKLCRSLNLPFLHILNPEKYDLLLLSRQFSFLPQITKPKVFGSLVNLNYLSGYLIGNKRYALRKYLQLIRSVIRFCSDRNIKIIVLGPAIRSNTYLETRFSKDLERFMSKSLKSENISYIFGLEKHQQNEKTYFNSNGIHATKLYHDLIASRLLSVIRENKVIVESVLDESVGKAEVRKAEL